MTTRRQAVIALSAAAFLGLVTLPLTASATDLAVPTQAAEAPQAAPIAKPTVHLIRKPARLARRWSRPARYVARPARPVSPVRYVSRPAAPAIHYAALERRWSPIFLGVGF